jgi:hypothetical protein
MKNCSNCGAELKPEAKFCPACGTRVMAETTAPSQPESRPLYQSESEPAYRKEQPVQDQAKEATHAFKEALTGRTNIVHRVINILVKPKEEWHVIAGEQPNAMKLIGGYALVLALIPAISAFIRYGILGYSVMGFTSHSISSGIEYGLIQLLSAVFGVYLLAWVVDLLAPTFDSEKNFGRSLQLAVYSSTAQWVAGILMLVSTTMSILVMLVTLYAIYLLAVGMPVLKKTPQEKVVGYVVLVIVAMFALTIVLSLIFGAFLGLFFVNHAVDLNYQTFPSR